MHEQSKLAMEALQKAHAEHNEAAEAEAEKQLAALLEKERELHAGDKEAAASALQRDHDAAHSLVETKAESAAAEAAREKERSAEMVAMVAHLTEVG